MNATVLKMADTSAPVITLRQRIADALIKPTSSAEVRSCIAHTQADLARVERERQRAEAKAVDPLSTEEEATEGKRECEGLRFDLERLTASENRLKARLEAVAEEEDQGARREQYDAAVSARDKAAETLRTAYPKAVAEIRNALLMLEDAEAKVIAANQRRPHGAEHIMGAESKALGQPVGLASGPHALALEVRLPARFGSGMWPMG